LDFLPEKKECFIMPQSNRVHRPAKNGAQGRSARNVSHAAAEAKDYMSRTLHEQPLTIAWVSFAAGVAVGAGAVVVLCQSQSSSHTTVNSLAARITDAVMNALPNQWRSAMSS
jgi:hypothetical protein